MLTFISSTPEGVAWRLHETGLMVVLDRETGKVVLNDERPISLSECPTFVKNTVRAWLASRNRLKGAMPGPHIESTGKFTVGAWR